MLPSVWPAQRSSARCSPIRPPTTRSCCIPGSVSLRNWRQRPLPVYRWWARMSPVYWAQDYRGVRRMVCLTMSTRAALDQGQRVPPYMGAGHRPRDAVRHSANGMDTTVTGAPCERLARNLEFPVLVIYGDRDKLVPPRDSRALARLSNGRLEAIPGAGHVAHGRKAVPVNLALRAFAEECLRGARTPTRPRRLPSRRAPPRPVRLLADRARARSARPRNRP